MADEGSVTPKVELKTLSLLRVVDLKSELDQRGLSKSGSKKDLIDRLKVRLQLENIQAESAASCVEGQVPNMSLQDDETGQNIFVKQYLADQQRTYEKEKEARKNIDKEREDSSSQEIEESMSEEDLSSRNMCKQNTISSGEKEISADLESVGRLRRSSRKPRTPVSENTEVEENADGDGKTQVEETGTEETEEEMSLIQSSLESNGDADTKIKGGNVRLILEKVDVTVANETLKHEIQKQSEDKGSGKLDVVCDPEDDLNLGMKGSSGENTSSVDRKINASERKSAESEVGKSKEGRRRRWDNKRVSEDKSDINDQTKDNKIKLKRRTSNQGSDQAGEADRDEKYKSNEGDVTVDDADKIKRSTRNDRVGLEKANRRSSVANVEEKRDDKLKKPDAVEKKEDEISGDLVNSKKLSSETGKDSADRKSTLTKKSQEGDVRSVVKNTNDEVNVERKSRSRQRRKEKRSESESSSSDGSRSSSSGSSSGSSRASKNSSRSNSASSSSSGSTSSSSGSSSSSTSQSSKSAAEDETSTKVSKPKDSSNKLHSKRNTSAAELRKETSEPSKLEDGAKADDSNKKEKNAKKRTSSPDDGRKSRRKRSTSPGDGKKTIDKKSAVAGDVSIRSSKTSPAPGDKRKSRTKRSPSAEKKKKRDSKKRSETPERRGGRSQKRSKSPDEKKKDSKRSATPDKKSSDAKKRHGTPERSVKPSKRSLTPDKKNKDSKKRSPTPDKKRKDSRMRSPSADSKRSEPARSSRSPEGRDRKTRRRSPVDKKKELMKKSVTPEAKDKKSRVRSSTPETKERKVHKRSATPESKDKKARQRSRTPERKSLKKGASHEPKDKVARRSVTSESDDTQKERSLTSEKEVAESVKARVKTPEEGKKTSENKKSEAVHASSSRHEKEKSSDAGEELCEGRSEVPEDESEKGERSKHSLHKKTRSRSSTPVDGKDDVRKRKTSERADSDDANSEDIGLSKEDGGEEHADIKNMSMQIEMAKDRPDSGDREDSELEMQRSTKHKHSTRKRDKHVPQKERNKESRSSESRSRSPVAKKAPVDSSKVEASSLKKQADKVSKEKDLDEQKPKVQRKRKWGSSSSSKKSSLSLCISTQSLKEILPEVKKTPIRINDLEDQVVSKSKENEDVEKEQTDVTSSKSIKHSKSLEFCKDDDEKLAEPASPVRSTTKVLHIKNLVRPFTISQLKELLSKNGKVADEDGFWIDKIKSKCYVKYENEESAFESRLALNNLKWPASNPKLLSVNFATEEEMKSHIEPATPVVDKKENENVKSSERGKLREERTAPVREWDRHKLTQSPDRSNERKRRSSGRQSSGSKKDVPKTNEEAPAKLLDDLFRKTKSTPCIYWLPLTDEQIKLRMEERKKRNAEREKRQLQRQREQELSKKSQQERQKSPERRHRSRSRSQISRRR